MEVFKYRKQVRIMKKERDYSKGIIYVIKNDVNNMIYVGSTTLTKEVRFSYHQYAINSPQHQNQKIYKAMREIGFENFYIELIEEYPCENIEQLEAREGHWIRELDSYNNGYNSQIAGRSKKENYDENRTRILEQKRQYYEDKKDSILEQRKRYYESNKEKVLEKVKKYQEDNRDKIRVRHREYEKKHREETNEKKREKVECECGKIISRGALPMHKKRKFHLSKVSLNK